MIHSHIHIYHLLSHLLYFFSLVHCLGNRSAGGLAASHFTSWLQPTMKKERKRIQLHIKNKWTERTGKIRKWPYKLKHFASTLFVNKGHKDFKTGLSVCNTCSTLEVLFLKSRELMSFFGRFMSNLCQLCYFIFHTHLLHYVVVNPSVRQGAYFGTRLEFYLPLVGFPVSVKILVGRLLL